jgi:signal-transduction protein with cAMP-binding, CBS, and nucleotidyltransferase domain
VTLRWWPRVREAELVAYLDEGEHKRLLAVSEIASVAAGEPILSKGSPSKSLLLLDEGEVEIVEESMGEDVVLATLGPGSVVGEVGFVDGQPRTHNVRARTACRLRRLTRDRLLDLVKDDPTLFAKLTIGLAEILARRFRTAVAEFEPLRAFAATIGEPMSLDKERTGEYEPLEMALPDPDPETDPEMDPNDPALALIREMAARARARLTGV